MLIQTMWAQLLRAPRLPNQGRARKESKASSSRLRVKAVNNSPRGWARTTWSDDRTRRCTPLSNLIFHEERRLECLRCWFCSTLKISSYGPQLRNCEPLQANLVNL